MVLTSTLRLIGPLSVLFCLVSLYRRVWLEFDTLRECNQVFNLKGTNWYDT